VKSIDHLLKPIGCTNCGRCCGVTACTGAEFDRVNAYAKSHGIEPRKQGINCPWLHDNKCAVYPVRPRVCALFGHVPEMECGEVPNNNISESLQGVLMKEVVVETRHTGMRMMHEVVMSLSEIVAATRHHIATDNVPLTINGVSGRRPGPKAYDSARTVALLVPGAFNQSLFVNAESGEFIKGR